MENIEKLSAFENIEILHKVDATDLRRTFGSRTFDRVTFNFPHTGGRLNIAKWRDLLERFFASAAHHVELFKGDICASLCQGRGEHSCIIEGESLERRDRLFTELQKLVGIFLVDFFFC